MGSSRFFGNRPDCAYYLLLGLCGAAVFTAFGGIFTYIGYWPQLAFHQTFNGIHAVPHTPSHMNTNYYDYSSSKSTDENETSIQVYSIIGPIFLTIGVGIALIVAVLAIKYDCEYEPEEPKIAILRLASEMSLNKDSKYELMSTRPSTTNIQMELTSKSNNGSSQQQERQAPATLTLARVDEEMEAGSSASSSRYMHV